MKIRIGFGYDMHKLQEGKELHLGGVKIDYPLGLVGHSDADVLIHAVCDALLGAANLGDIGAHFPDNDPQYTGIDSRLLLKRVVELLTERGYRIGNIDATICAEQPKLNSYIGDMQSVMADIMMVSANDVSIKATTSEKMGFVGRGEGIAAYAVALIT